MMLELLQEVARARYPKNTSGYYNIQLPYMLFVTAVIELNNQCQNAVITQPVSEFEYVIDNISWMIVQNSWDNIDADVKYKLLEYAQRSFDLM